MIQAILFKKNKWTFDSAKHYLTQNKIKYRSHRITDNYYRFRLLEPNYVKYKYRIERHFNGNKNIDYIFEY